MKEDIVSGGVSLQKLEVGDDLRVGFPTVTVLLFRLSFYLGNCSTIELDMYVLIYLAIGPELFKTHRILHRVGGLFVVLHTAVSYTGLPIFGFVVYYIYADALLT